MDIEQNGPAISAAMGNHLGIHRVLFWNGAVLQESRIDEAMIGNVRAPDLEDLPSRRTPVNRGFGLTWTAAGELGGAVYHLAIQELREIKSVTMTVVEVGG